MRLLFLASLGGFVVSAIVLIVSVVQLFRMRSEGSSHRRHRHRSRLSKLRAHLFADESLRRPSRSHRSHSVRRATVGS
jgi:hypothetical protein